MRGDYGYAAAVHRESLQLRWDAAVWEDVAASLADLAVARRGGRAAGAGRPALRGRHGRARGDRTIAHANFPERAVFERAEARARAALGADAFAAAAAAGRALPREQAVAEATALADDIHRDGAEQTSTTLPHLT